MVTSNTKSTNPVLKGLSVIMKKEGFIRKASNWYLNTDETILVANIQSCYSSRYINFGIWIKKLADKEYINSFKKYNTVVKQEHPKHYQCHIYFRPIHFPESINPIAEAVFNLEDMSVSNEDRQKYIVEWLDKYEMPLLKQCSTIEGIIKAIFENKFKFELIRIEVKKFIMPFLIIALKNLIIKKTVQPQNIFENRYNVLTTDNCKDITFTQKPDTDPESSSSVVVGSNSGLTSLMLATSRANLKAVNKLLKAGKDPNKQDRDGWTALMIAAQKCYVNVVNLLLAHGAQPNISTSDGGTTALTAASDKGCAEVVDNLLTSGSEVDLATDSGWTALMYASQNGHYRVVRKLLNKGADVNKVGDGGWTALMLASQEGHIKVVEELLLDKKVKINEANDEGMTPIMLAIDSKHVNIVAKLLEKGADPNISVKAEKNEGWTALMFASSEGLVEIVSMLLEKGANTGKENKEGFDAIDIAEYFEHKKCVTILKKHLA
jgi:ankyrin repeat protein